VAGNGLGMAFFTESSMAIFLSPHSPATTIRRMPRIFADLANRRGQFQVKSTQSQSLQTNGNCSST
jgi:hypothetical protein